MKRGYLYIAYGARYLAEARRSMAQLRAVDPEAEITVLGDSGHRGKYDAKMLQLGDAPYERTIFFDTDTYCIASPRPLFDLLDCFDVCMAPAPKELDLRQLEPPFHRRAGLRPCNSGVIVYRSGDATQAMWRLAAERYRRLDHKIFLAGHPDPQKSDQSYIASAIADTDVRLHVLPSEWNFRTPFFGIARGEVKILHGRGDMPAVAAEVNRTHKERLWNPRTNQIQIL